MNTSADGPPSVAFGRKTSVAQSSQRVAQASSTSVLNSSTTIPPNNANNQLSSEKQSTEKAPTAQNSTLRRRESSAIRGGANQSTEDSRELKQYQMPTKASKIRAESRSRRMEPEPCKPQVPK